MRPGSVDPLTSIGTAVGEPDPSVVRSIVEVCGRTDRARAVPRIRVLAARLPAPEGDQLAVHLGRRARRLVVAVWAAGGEPVFLDGAARLVGGVPPALGPEVGAVLRRRRDQPLAAWIAAAGAVGSELDDVVVVLGALVESLIDDLAAALGVERTVVEEATWSAPHPVAPRCDGPTG